MRSIVTRPAQQADAWVADLRRLGLQAEPLPLIAIEAPADPAAVRAAWSRLDRLDLAMFVSANAVRQFMAAAPPGARWPPALRAAATGPGTAAALLEAGVAPALLTQPARAAAQFDSEALWARLAPECWRGLQVAIVRGETGRSWLAEQWVAQGAHVDFVVAYRRTLPPLDAAARALLQAARADPPSHLWLFSSSESIVHLQRLAVDADWRSSTALVTHGRVAAAARAAGFGAVTEVEPTLAAVAAACRRHADLQEPGLG